MKSYNRIKIKKINSQNKQLTRLTVYRSNTAMYAMLIDDKNGKVLKSISSKSTKQASIMIGAEKVGLEIAKYALENKIREVIFDRNGYKYHGQVKAVALGARAGGLKF